MNSNKRVLDEWEPEEFKEMLDNAVPLQFQPEVVSPYETLKAANANVILRVDTEVDTWVIAPSEDMRKCLYVVALYLEENYVWHANNDILATRILDMFFAKEFRAHPDGVYQCVSGHWAFVEEFMYPTIRKTLRILGDGAKVMKYLHQQQTSRVWQDVFNVLEYNHGDVEGSPAACHSDLSTKCKPKQEMWALEGGKVMLELVVAYSGKGKPALLIDSYGTYFQIEKPNSAYPYVDLENVTFRLDPRVAARGALRFTAVKKDADHNCYFGLPISLEYKPPDHNEEEMRLFLCTSFAGNAEGRKMDLAQESLVWYDEVMPQLSIIFTGDGGNSKSAKAIIRANVLAAHHKFVSSEVLQVPDEFRKQMCHNARARYATVQENQAGVPWLEDAVKRWISGEFNACRPLFGKTTEMFSWRKCAKAFEWNRTYPSIKGDWRNMQSLRAFWRRLAAIELGAVFSSDPNMVTIAGRVFPEKDLTAFLESPVARLIYTKSYLIPFIQTLGQTSHWAYNLFVIIRYKLYQMNESI